MSFALPRPAYAYTFKAVNLTLAGVPISRYGPDGGIEFDTQANLVESETTADGYVIYTAQNDDRITCTVTISQFSPQYDEIMEIIRGQMLGINVGLGIPPLPTSLFDPATGDLFASEYTVFVKEPMPNKTKTLGPVTIEVEFPYGRWGFLRRPNVI